MERFCTKLKEAGASLVFFKDGPIQNFKYETWTDRQNERYKRTLSVLKHIQRRLMISDIVTKKEGKIPGIMNFELEHFAKKYGEFHVSIERECDLETAIYANNNALAIISHDTDYFIFKGNWKYWSSEFINFENFTTMEFNRQAVNEYLGLTYDEMPYLATLAGNDAISQLEVQDFHKRLGDKRHKFLNIADYIKKAPKPIDDNVLKRMFGHIYGPDLRPETVTELMRKFKSSLDLYDLNYKKINFDEMEPIVQILLIKCNDLAYNLYTGNVIEVTTTYYDYRQTDMGNIIQTLTALFAKMAGIILYHRQTQDVPTTFKLYIRKPHVVRGFVFQFVDEEAVFPKNIIVPPLMELHSEVLDPSNDLLDVKYTMLCWIVSENLKCTDEIRHFDKEYITTALALYGLVDQKYITIFEADLLMLSLHRAIQKTIPDDFEYPTYLNFRDFRLAFLLSHMHKMIKKAFDIVGVKNGRLPTKFDGAYYHSMRNKLRLMSDAEKNESIKEIQPYRLYSSLNDEKKGSSAKKLPKKVKVNEYTYLCWRRR